VATVLGLLLLLVWHAPLGVRCFKRRQQSPEWTILSHSYRLTVLAGHQNVSAVLPGSEEAAVAAAASAV